MFQDAPIYHRLVAERGDVPARVRDAAESIRRELEGVMRTGQPPGPSRPDLFTPTSQGRQASALPPGSLPQ
ncbi:MULTISPECIES: hypothetical protein [Streptomyces]|uniref:Uncharacterized protein n=1 Tax=Streptomyces gibsoniae TaxID=3075529 RepID=A0ABU2U2M8_9ACTN|nr:hypothetical protein [Streptomyces sp. DSM 41699]MDT0467480.1 hypothetical protein [Streptomyces sp. DSM 41699]